MRNTPPSLSIHLPDLLPEISCLSTPYTTFCRLTIHRSLLTAHLSLSFFLFFNLKPDVTSSHQSIGLWVWNPHFLNIQKQQLSSFAFPFADLLQVSIKAMKAAWLCHASLLLASKPLARVVYIFIHLIAAYLLILNSSYSSHFSNLGGWRGQKPSFINTHYHHQRISLAVVAGGHGCVTHGFIHRPFFSFWE